MISKNILVQYCDLQKEIKELRNRINRIELSVAKILREGNVIDTVSGGSGGIEHFKIEGFPYGEYDAKVSRLASRTRELRVKEEQLLEMMNETESFINNIPDSHMRRILNMRYIDNMSWVQIGYAMNSTADACRMANERFFTRLNEDISLLDRVEKENDN